MDLAALFATTSVAVLASMLFVWALSLVRRDASIVDVFWGIGFVVVAAVAFAFHDGGTPRARIALALTALWGLRLGGYLLWRNWGQGEDFRYRRMREHHGARFPLVSLFTVFGLQGVLMWIVSLPVQLAIASPTPERVGALDLAGVLLFALGLAFESVGDLQLARFKADPANRGRVMDRGLWAWTRHPNYFGDACVWWGLGALGLATPYGVFGLIGPAVMHFFLVRVSGVALLEKSLAKRRPGYEEYVRRTPAFLPRPPRR